MAKGTIQGAGRAATNRFPCCAAFGPARWPSMRPCLMLIEHYLATF